MTARQLGILARSTDPVAARLIEAAERAGHVVNVVPLAALVEGVPVALQIAAGRTQLTCNGVDLLALHAVLVRALPSPTALVAPPETIQDAATWYRLQKQQRDRSSAARAAVHVLADAGVVVLNPTAALIYDDKPTQLAALARAAIPIPATLVTNDAEEVARFRAAHGACVMKPVSGGAPAEELTAAAHARLHAHAGTPAIVQARAAGALVRITVVDGVAVTAVRVDSPLLDPRTDPAFATGGVAFLPFAPSAALAELACAAAAACHHVVSGVDLRVDGAHAVVLECNSAPQFLDDEAACAADVAGAIVQAALRRI